MIKGFKVRCVAAAAATALMLPACSSKPRQFDPVLQAAPANQAAYEQDRQACEQQVAAQLKKKRGKDRLASGGAAAAGTLGAGAVGTVAASGGTYATVGGAMAAMGAVMVAMPVVGVAAAWGMAKAKKSKKERAIKQATRHCLEERGYEVASWVRAQKRKASR